MPATCRTAAPCSGPGPPSVQRELLCQGLLWARGSGWERPGPCSRRANTREIQETGSWWHSAHRPRGTHCQALRGKKGQEGREGQTPSLCSDGRGQVGPAHFHPGMRWFVLQKRWRSHLSIQQENRLQNTPESILSQPSAPLGVPCAPGQRPGSLRSHTVARLHTFGGNCSTNLVLRGRRA